jgi:pentatricopeptide repeat protein
MKPIETPVFKREMKLVTTELNEFFEIYPRSEKTYNTFIRGLAAMGEYQKAKEALIDMRKQGLKPNVMVYTSLMTGCVASKDVDEAFRIFETILKEGLQPTNYTFGVLANVCVKSGQLNRAYSLVELTKKYDIPASPVLYSSLIHGCLLEEQVDRAWQTWDHMRTWTGLVPDEVQYTLMINACTMREEAERALMLYDEMAHLKMQPTEVTYNSLLQCLSTRKDFYKDAFDVLEKMKNDGFAPDVYTLTLLLKTAARGGDAKTAELIFDQLMMIPEAAKQENAYAWMIHGYSVAHRVDMTKTTPNIEKGTKIYEKMVENGVKPTNFTVNQYLSLFTEALRLNRAMEVMKTEFEKHALVPDDYAYNSLIKMFARVHKAERAIDMFNLMKAEKIEPNKATYSFLIDACTKSQLYTSGVTFLKEMKEKGFSIHWSEDFVMKFKAACGKLTQVAKEIDQITGRDRRYVPSFRKPGTRQFQKADRRELTEEDKKQLREQGRVSSLFKDPLPNKI